MDSEHLNQAYADQYEMVVGSDMYNLQLTGGVTATITAATGSSSTHSGPTVIIKNRRKQHRQDTEIDADKQTVACAEQEQDA